MGMISLLLLLIISFLKSSAFPLQIISTIQKCLYKRLREAHASVSLCAITGYFCFFLILRNCVPLYAKICTIKLVICMQPPCQYVSYISCSLVIFLQICSCVQFIPWRPWTGSGLSFAFFMFCLLLFFLLFFQTCRRIAHLYIKK
jgi:hypothetical protein